MKISIAGPRRCRLALVLTVIFIAAQSSGYSVLTHEELIDLAWNDSIQPLLQARFPNATQHQLVEAHAYAYGGSAIQDMGYYPFGKRLFSNLTHYVRTGDFVDWMLQNASTIDEYAFAIGALSHYLGDTIGHSEAINPVTAIEFPKLAKKFGPKVTYGESPHGHIRTEFAFDVDELTNQEFAPPAYLRTVGFKVPRRFLERAFVAIYGFDIREVLRRPQSSLRSYSTSVRTFIRSEVVPLEDQIDHDDAIPESNQDTEQSIETIQGAVDDAQVDAQLLPERRQALFDRPPAGAADDVGDKQNPQPILPFTRTK